MINIKTWKKYIGDKNPIEYYLYGLRMGYRSIYGIVAMEDTFGEKELGLYGEGYGEKIRRSLEEFLKHQLTKNGFKYNPKSEIWSDGNRTKEIEAYIIKDMKSQGFKWDKKDQVWRRS